MDSALDTVLATVGPRLRALRPQRDMTLADLSAATDISVSTLSRLEYGQRRPNLELLRPLARASEPAAAPLHRPVVARGDLVSRGRSRWFGRRRSATRLSRVPRS